MDHFCKDFRLEVLTEDHGSSPRADTNIRQPTTNNRQPTTDNRQHILGGFETVEFSCDALCYKQAAQILSLILMLHGLWYSYGVRVVKVYRVGSFLNLSAHHLVDCWLVHNFGRWQLKDHFLDCPFTDSTELIETALSTRYSCVSVLLG
jgi:hypothetical protein